MRTGKELILSSKQYTTEDRSRSWLELFLTLGLLIVCLTATFFTILPIYVRLLCGLLTSCFYIRMFVIYHDYQHHAILQGSVIATIIMKAYGIFMLTPQNVWKRSHDHHHNHNSKLSTNGIGSYPTISTKCYLSLCKNEQRMYLINRHPVTVIFGHLTLFIYWLNIKSFLQSPGKHMDSLVALLFHYATASLIWYYFGFVGFVISWFLPFFVAFAMGSYLFYSQHNFPGAQFRENQDWKYDQAALSSTSFMLMNPVLRWLTGNIGYHHVHHLNSRIPFYRLIEAMNGIPELQHVVTTTWSPVDMWKCFQLKLWDAEKSSMIPMSKLSR
ncbi:MAG: fatty acid desaturase [Cytophagales bacterium]|nr:fatty acid desaturase [Cytophaga sp.]